MAASDDYQVLVARFRREDELLEAHDPEHWRARIIYVNNGRRFYAASIDDAFAIMRSLILTGTYQR